MDHDNHHPSVAQAASVQETLIAEIVAKAVTREKQVYADGVWDRCGKDGNENGIAAAIHDAEQDPDGPAAHWLKDRNERIERYTTQAEVGPIQFEPRKGRNQS